MPVGIPDIAKQRESFENVNGLSMEEGYRPIIPPILDFFSSMGEITFDKTSFHPFLN